MKYARPTINIEVYEIFKEDKEMMWNLFKKHHYLTDKLNKASRCFIAKWKNQIIGFDSVLPLPSGTLKNAWREHRLVILSDFQGLGIGNALSETIGEILVSDGKRFYSKTANKKLGEYRDNSIKWKNTTTNHKNRLKMNDKSKLTRSMVNEYLRHRTCYSHEYVGTFCTALDK